jgi:general secretion pathway protein G
MITLVLVGIVSMTALPLMEAVSIKQKEAELRQSLRTIRAALDAYKAASDAGVLPKAAGESGFPASLDLLTQSLDTARPRGPANAPADAPQRIVFLRQLPRDPFSTDPAVPAARTWNTRSYASRPDDPQPGPDVFDVSSRSDRAALNGTAYNSW